MAKSKFQLYLDAWKKGCGGPDCSKAKHIVHYRGNVPCDVLFVGEAPGESEDVLGRPFAGPAGKLLDYIIDKALGDIVIGAGSLTEDDVSDGVPVKVGITNLVGCIPRDEDDRGRKAHEPSVEAIMACSGRLQCLIDMSPRLQLVVGVGKLAEDWLDPKYNQQVKLPNGVQFIAILHPSFLLRQNVVIQGLLVQQQIVRLRTAALESIS